MCSRDEILNFTDWIYLDFSNVEKFSKEDYEMTAKAFLRREYFDDAIEEDHMDHIYDLLMHACDSNETFDEWLDGIYKKCFEMMEGADAKEFSLFSCIADAIAKYRDGDSSFVVCNPFNVFGCPFNRVEDEEEVEDER